MWKSMNVKSNFATGFVFDLNFSCHFLSQSKSQPYFNVIRLLGFPSLEQVLIKSNCTRTRRCNRSYGNSPIKSYTMVFVVFFPGKSGGAYGLLFT